MDIINNIFSIKLLRDSVHFKIIFVIWALVHSLSQGQYITGYLSLPIIAWGGLLLLRNVFISRKDTPKIILYLIYAFLGAYIVTIFLNRDSNLIGNTKTLIWSSILMLVLFLSEPSKSKDEIDKDISKISNVIILCTLFITIFSLALYFLNITYWVNRVDGPLIPQGYYAARLWGVFVDPNQACVVALVSMLISFIVLIQKRAVNKSLVITNSVLQYIFMVLTGSRGGEIGFVLVVIGLGYITFQYLFSNKISNKVLRSVLAIISGIIITIIITASFSVTREILATIPELSAKARNVISESTGLQIGHISENVTSVRPDVESSNGRITLWKDGLRLSKFSPIWGFGDRNIPSKAEELTPGSSLTKQYVHNGYIHMLLGGGIVAVVIMMTLLTIIAIKALKIIFGNNNYYKDYYVYSVMCLLIGMLLVTSVFLTEIFYQNSFATSIFWIYLGYVVYLGNQYKIVIKR